MNYIEQNCILHHNGKSHISGGAYVDDKSTICYLAGGNKVTNWHGKDLGTYRTVSTWRTPRSYCSSTMSQVEVTIDGVVYTGRSMGVGMIFKGNRKARQ